MTATIKIDTNGFQLMRDFIEQNCGIYLADDKMYLLETRLTKLMVESGCSSFVDFYHKAASDDTYKLRDKVIEAIKANDDWREMVIRRIPKLIGRLNDKNRIEYLLAINSHMDIKQHIKTMQYIEKKLKKK